MMKRNAWFSAVWIAGLMITATVWAGETNWPQRPVELVVPYAAGGDTDFNARCLAKYLTQELGRNFVITNISGAGGSLAMDEVHNSDPDGYRFLVNHSSMHTVKAFGVSDYGYEAFDPVCIFGRGTGEFLTVRADFPADNFQEFVEYTKQNPGEVKFGYNPGATSHYLAVKMSLEGADMNLVSTGSAAERVVGLKGGHLDVIASAMPIIADYITTNEFKVLGNCSSQRYPSFPDIPTLLEQGSTSSFDVDYTLYAVKGTDPAIIEKLAGAVRKVMDNPDYATEIKQAYNQVPVFMDTDSTIELLAKQQAGYMAISEELRSNF